MKKILVVMFCMAMVLGIITPGFSGDVKTVDVAADVPPTTALTINIAKVTPGTPGVSSDSFAYGQPSVNFGTLTYDPVNFIWICPFYFAVDVGVDSNQPNWTVTHVVSPMNAVGSSIVPTPSLDNNINVTFSKVSDPLNPLYLRSWATSNNIVITSANVAGSFLRVYYGIATGAPGENAAFGTSPITNDANPNGNYFGQVTFTLAP